jgi:hypothetical protein
METKKKNLNVPNPLKVPNQKEENSILIKEETSSVNILFVDIR